MENTRFAGSGTAAQEALERDIALASSNAVIAGVLKLVGGLLAVLNRIITTCG